MPFEIKKRGNPIIIVAVALGKNPFKIISFYVFIVIFNIRLEHRFRKMIVLINNDFKENFISQRFVKENNLISDLMGRMKKFIDRYAIIIYGKYDLIIHIKDSQNQNQMNIINFLATDIERYDIILG
jgi:hypothetical protein